MIVMPEPKVRVGRSGGCDRWIGSPLGRAQVVDLAGRRRNAANRTAAAPPGCCVRQGPRWPAHLLNTQLRRRSCPHKPARQEFDAGHIPSNGHLPEKSRRMTHPPLQQSSYVAKGTFVESKPRGVIGHELIRRPLSEPSASI